MVHQGIDVLRVKLVPEVIRFPIGSDLEQVFVEFEALCGLPDGTFMPRSLQNTEIPTLALVRTSLSCLVLTGRGSSTVPTFKLCS